jgi:hypothetical protein
MGTTTQFRLMGGAIGLAITTSVLNGFIRSHLSKVLSIDDIVALLQTSQTLENFDPIVQAQIRQVFAAGYTLQIKIVIGFAAGQILASAIMWQKKNIIV